MSFRSTHHGLCLWCHHEKYWHNGRVDPEVRARPANARVKWTTSACSHAGCECRRYEK